MKRIVLSILLFAACLCGALAQNDAMFVYRNDGQINAFLKADVDSIRYSQIGVDSLYHAEFVVQEVWTPDSVYRIPLAAVDSVSFVTPPTVYKTDVTRLDGTLLDYVTGSDSLTLKLRSDTPVGIIPKAGDKLVLLDGCEALPYGFSGIVSEVRTETDGIDVVCEQAYLEDLFDSFCSVSTMYGTEAPDARYVASSGQPNRVVYNPADATFRLGPFTIDGTSEISGAVTPNGDLAIKVGRSSMSLSVQPTFRVHTFLILGEGHGTYFNCSITGDISIVTNTSIYGGIEYNHDFEKKGVKIPIPNTVGLINFYFLPGFFGRIGATVSSNLSVTRTYAFGMAYDYSSIGESVIKPTLGCRPVSTSMDIEGLIEGNLAVGGFIETGFSILSRDIAKVFVRGELGWQVNGDFVLRNSDIEEAERDTRLYERIKASGIETGPFVNLSLQSSLFDVGPSFTIFEGAATLLKRDIVPAFSNTELTRASGSSMTASTRMSGNCVFPVSVGFKLFDEGKNEIADFDATVRYTNEEGRLDHSFTGVDNGKLHTLYPKVRLFGFDILASPSSDLAMAHPEITDFEITASKYSPGAFVYEGIAYDYSFDVTMTAEIDNLDGVADWGYVYKDTYGNIERYSAMEFGTSYTTSYVCLRRDAKSTACLYTYVKYEGDPEYYDSEPQYYPLEYSRSVAHPEITNFEVTGWNFSKEKEFYNDGVEFYFKFDVAITAKIDSLDGVSDWGYVYKDPYGNIKRISLMQYGAYYTDNRYSYFRNDEKSTACIYPYVKYNGDPEYYDGEPCNYILEINSCPDDHHPHAIDLGLPSGTKWCCCNVGATSPVEYGGYYAWGEISEKSEYTEENYAYYDNETSKYIDIGSEISGTQYDVAHVVMGDPWCMPTKEQMQEFAEYIYFETIKLNGHEVISVIGPSGQIFIPCAGYWRGDFRCRGCDTWTGSLSYYGSESFVVDLDNGVHIEDRCQGFPVRPVCK